jgi:hypothetical protein
MKASEILRENTADQLLSTINDLLASNVAKGVTTVSVAKLVNVLQGMGHNATEEGILSVINNSPFVKSAQGDNVDIGEEPSLADTGENSGDQVDSMADSAVDI